MIYKIIIIYLIIDKADSESDLPKLGWWVWFYQTTATSYAAFLKSNKTIELNEKTYLF
jgi:hypothetical protein